MNQSRACLYHNTRFIQVRCPGELSCSSAYQQRRFYSFLRQALGPSQGSQEETLPRLCQISEKHDNNSLASQILIFQRGKCIFFKAEGSSLEFSYIVWVINVLFGEQTEARSLRETSIPLCLLKKTLQTKKKINSCRHCFLTT